MTILALDIGGTHVTAARIRDEAARPDAAPVRLNVDQAWPADIILDCWARAARQASEPGPIRALGIAVPGPFDYHTGVARFDEHFHDKMRALAGLDVGGALRQRWADTPLAARPITFVNDAIAFALGEAHHGPHGPGRLLGVTLGTGLGSGFIDQGRAVTSRGDVPPGGLINQWPLRGGPAETHLSAPGLRRDYHALSGRDEEPRRIAERAQQGDQLARTLFASFGRDLGTVLLPVAQAFQPAHIVIGGQLSRAWPLFGPALNAALAPFTAVQSTLLDDASLLGAAHSARHQLTTAPDAPSASLQGGSL